MVWDSQTDTKNTRQYLVEVQAEYKKITWPPQKEAMAGTIDGRVVVVIVTVVTTASGVVDFAWTKWCSDSDDGTW